MRSYGHFCGYGGELNGINWSLEAEEEVRKLAQLEHPVRTGWSIHRDLVSIYVREAQEAVSTWMACQHEGGLDALIEPEINEQKLAEVRAEDPDIQDFDQLRALELWFRLGKLKHSLHAAPHVFSIGIGNLTDRRPTIYSVAYLQLYNHIAEKATIRECANETCRRSFVRQRGRAEY
ncbi:hypothetical protein ACFWN5_43735, partial [Streptomyces sp. NPDC058430]